MDETMSVRSSGSFKMYDDRSSSPSTPPALESARHHTKHKSFHVRTDYGVGDKTDQRNGKRRDHRGRRNGGVSGGSHADMGITMSSGKTISSGNGSRHARRRNGTSGPVTSTSTISSGDHYEHQRQIGTDLSTVSGVRSSSASGKAKRNGKSKQNDTHNDRMAVSDDVDRRDRDKERKRKQRVSKASKQGW